MSHYYADSGQLDKGITALELYKQTYPRDAIPYNNVANIYDQLGQFENGLENARQAVLLDPDSLSGYANLASAYAGLKRIDEAKATLNQALQRKLGVDSVHLQLAGLAWAQNDITAFERELTLAKATPSGEMTALEVEVFASGGARTTTEGKRTWQTGESRRRSPILKRGGGQRVRAGSVNRSAHE